MAIKLKTQVDMTLQGDGETHARTRVRARDVEAVIDEPAARGGTNQGLTPTEALMASLIGCTNVITQRLAHREGVKVQNLGIALQAKFDRRGAALEEQVETPFSDIVMDIRVKTDASREQMARIQADLPRYCPVSKVIRGSGATITENWIIEES